MRNTSELSVALTIITALHEAGENDLKMNQKLEKLKITEMKTSVNGQKNVQEGKQTSLKAFRTMWKDLICVLMGSQQKEKGIGLKISL